MAQHISVNDLRHHNTEQTLLKERSLPFRSMIPTLHKNKHHHKTPNPAVTISEDKKSFQLSDSNRVICNFKYKSNLKQL